MEAFNDAYYSPFPTNAEDADAFIFSQLQQVKIPFSTRSMPSQTRFISREQSVRLVNFFNEQEIPFFLLNTPIDDFSSINRYSMDSMILSITSYYHPYISPNLPAQFQQFHFSSLLPAREDKSWKLKTERIRLHCLRHHFRMSRLSRRRRFFQSETRSRISRPSRPKNFQLDIRPHMPRLPRLRRFQLDIIPLFEVVDNNFCNILPCLELPFAHFNWAPDLDPTPLYIQRFCMEILPYFDSLFVEHPFITPCMHITTANDTASPLTSINISPSNVIKRYPDARTHTLTAQSESYLFASALANSSLSTLIDTSPSNVINVYEPTHTLSPKALLTLIQALCILKNAKFSRFPKHKPPPNPYIPLFLLPSFASRPVPLVLYCCPYRRGLSFRPGVRSWNREGVE